MSFKKILVPLAGIDGDGAAIDAALLLGREFEAHIEALYARTARGRSPDNQITREKLVGSEIEQADETKAGHARTLFSSRCAACGVKTLETTATAGLSANYREPYGIEADLIAEHGRLSDLIVVPHPGWTDRHRPSISMQAALRETARPVLLVQRAVASIGKRNVIAWNGSLEAARAVAFAVPILRRGASTLVVTIGNHDIQPSGDKVVEYLRWHGIEAKSTVVPVQESSESSTLLAGALSAEADLIILGAYTRYRTGRPTFGSMTTEMIAQNKIPVFMAH